MNFINGLLVVEIMKRYTNLLEVTDQQKELSQWTLGDKVKLEEGRFVLTPGKNTKGSLWLKPEYSIKDAMTIEWTFRSSSKGFLLAEARERGGYLI
ncbi:ATV_HP_G0016640.mRNA.1.CDS.1 [Saccharomyces cerevisiae]|nr:ATV_HP_G0016640.mRNA.1.CDS.1 [Saccharomyces cerevisiae]CAI6951754.1 ATV_HP_G0016640.mRNA.1.CDS.1 [Saccharomyces cerevisiae]